MSWSAAQSIRLDTELALLASELPYFQVVDREKDEVTTVRGVYTSSFGRNYMLAVWLKSGYPHAMPSLYVISPSPLTGFQGKSMAEFGNSHSMHTWESDWSKFTKLCFCKEKFWSSSDTILGILLKGFLWLEAYEVYARKGKTIDEFSLTYKS